MAEKSKPFSIFLNRVGQMRLQIDGVEASLEIVASHLAHKVDKKDKISEVLGFGEKKYPSLNRAVGKPTTVINKIRTTNYEFIVQALYTYFTEFLRGVLLDLYKNSPLQVVGKHNGTISYVEIVKMGSYERVVRSMVDDVFRKFENERSTLKLVKSVLKGTSVELDPDQLNELLMFLELRHIMVHRAGKLDQKFIDKFERQSGLVLKVDSKMPMNIGFARRALKIAEEIAASIDEQIMVSSQAPDA